MVPWTLRHAALWIAIVMATGSVRGVESPSARKTSLVVDDLVVEDDEPTVEEVRELLDVMSLTGRQAMARGDLQRAETIFRGIVERDAGHIGGVTGLAQLLLKSGETQAAVDVLREGIQRSPESPEIARLLGRAYRQSGDTERSDYWTNRSRSTDAPATGRYNLAIIDLRCSRPMSALDKLWCLSPSDEDMIRSRDLAIGVAYGQLDLPCEASAVFSCVARHAAGTKYAEQARQLQTAMDRALDNQPRCDGRIKVALRHDTNPAVVPSANNFGVPLSARSSSGAAYEGDFNYSLFRDYNVDLVAGYSFLQTSNTRLHGFDLTGNAANLTASRRRLWGDRPVVSALRLDYDHLLLGSDPFLQRAQVTPWLSVTHSDWDTTTLVARYSLYDFSGPLNVNHTAFDQDADNMALGILHHHQLAERDMTLFAGYHYDRTFADGSNFDYQGHRVQVGVEWNLPCWGMQLVVEGNGFFRDYDHPHTVFGRPRRDDQFYAHVQLVRPVGNDWRVVAEWTGDRNDSNLVTNDYRRSLVGLGIEYRFPR